MIAERYCRQNRQQTTPTAVWGQLQAGLFSQLGLAPATLGVLLAGRSALTQVRTQRRYQFLYPALVALAGGGKGDCGVPDRPRLEARSSGPSAGQDCQFGEAAEPAEEEDPVLQGPGYAEGVWDMAGKQHLTRFASTFLSARTHFPAEMCAK